MAFDLKIQSIPDLNQKLNRFLSSYVSILMIVTLAVLTLFFHSYNKKSYKLAQNAISIKFAKFLSNYEHHIISISSQPIFRNLLGADNNMLESIDIDNPFYYGLKRQIASLTAPYKTSTIFEGSLVENNYHKAILTQGLTSSPYRIAFKLCYRDSILSFDKGAPCLGTWTFYINQKKLLTNLKKERIEITHLKKSNLPIRSLFDFDILTVANITLPPLFFKIEVPNTYIKFIVSIVIATLFLSMIFLAKIIVRIYRKNYLNFILKIHHHLTKNKLIINEEFNQSPDEISDLVLAVNKALKHRKFEAIENLAHDLKPALNRLQEIASKIDNQHKQDLLSIHTQCYLAIHKIHNTSLENLDIQKVLYDCIFSIYMEQYNAGIIHINATQGHFFCRGSYPHLIRIISNIVENALKATAKTHTPKINISLYVANYMTKIDIQDNGPGIPQKKIYQIFLDGKSFTGSSGKGLSFCKEMIESWQGRITCHSFEKNGTTFSLGIPRSKCPFDYIETIFYNNDSRFIIIDDEKHFHHYLSKKIPENLQIIHIYNITELVNFFSIKTHLNDVFIIDYHFNEKLNGIEIINQYDLLGQAYLLSSSADCLKELYPEYRNRIPMLSKSYLFKLKYSMLSDIDCILVDDDIEILHDAVAIAKIKNIKLLPLNNFLQLKMILNLIPKIISITLDNNIDQSNETGIEFAKNLYDKGFLSLYLQTGEEINCQYHFLKKILQKGTAYDATP